MLPIDDTLKQLQKAMLECPCGSGLERRPKYDGYNIFLTYVCDKCEAEKMKGFREDIMERYDYDEDIEPEENYFDDWNS